MSTKVEEIKLVNKLQYYCLEKLRENHTKEHWINVPLFTLLQYLRKEIEELEQALINQEDPFNVWKEAGDISNFAAMIADVYNHIYNLTDQN